MEFTKYLIKGNDTTIVLGTWNNCLFMHSCTVWGPRLGLWPAVSCPLQTHVRWPLSHRNPSMSKPESRVIAGMQTSWLHKLLLKFSAGHKDLTTREGGMLGAAQWELMAALEESRISLWKGCTGWLGSPLWLTLFYTHIQPLKGQNLREPSQLLALVPDEYWP